MAFHLQASLVVMVFLSKGYFESKNCMRELHAAVALKKPLVLMHETDVRKGGESLDYFKAHCRQVDAQAASLNALQAPSPGSEAAARDQAARNI